MLTGDYACITQNALCIFYFVYENRITKTASTIMYNVKILVAV